MAKWQGTVYPFLTSRECQRRKCLLLIHLKRHRQQAVVRYATLSHSMDWYW